MAHSPKKIIKSKNIQPIENRNRSLSEKEEEILEYIGKNYENYQEKSIKRLDLASILQCSPALVNKLLKSLEKKGLIIHERYGEIKLTIKGKEISNTLIRRHRLAEALFVDILGLNASDAHEFACKFEHILDDQIANRIEEVLKNPNVCPHGNPIPSKGKNEDLIKNFPLNSFAPNEILRVSRILDEKSDLLRKLSQVGIEVGTEIKFIEKSPLDGTLLIEIDGKKVPIGEEIAKNLQCVLVSKRQV